MSNTSYAGYVENIEGNIKIIRGKWEKFLEDKIFTVFSSIMNYLLKEESTNVWLN